MKVFKMLNWLNCSFQCHKWYQLDEALQGKRAYKCKRCGMLRNDKKVFKHTVEILLPKNLLVVVWAMTSSIKNLTIALYLGGFSLFQNAGHQRFKIASGYVESDFIKRNSR